VWTTLYFVAVPPPVFWIATRCRTSGPEPEDRRRPWFRLLPLILLALGWFTQYGPDLFIDLRDHLLMSNTAGANVSSFYYRYTLYPAEVFKTLDQRQIKTVAWPPEHTAGRESPVGRELIRLDYLPVGAAAPADLGLQLDGDRLTLVHGATPVWEGPVDRFLADPRRAASDISTRTDRFAVFRTAAYYGVLLAFPSALYILLFALLRLLSGIAFTGWRAEAAAAILCLLAGFAILADFHWSREKPPRLEETAAALGSDRWQRRVAALKAIQAHRLDIGASSGFAAMLASPYPQERYWLARALATSPNPQATEDLIRLVADPQVNVRSMALQALAQRRDARAVQPILNLLKTSDEWYDQLYAYQALKALRWDQNRLP
ncbi:MAG TPA: HEAT repeat domain-containing protein, partial [Desulfobacterales bacterium]|nr:HEAT repeat domain-containing protein [Desulfobacterales bacterium]